MCVCVCVSSGDRSAGSSPNLSRRCDESKSVRSGAITHGDITSLQAQKQEAKQKVESGRAVGSATAEIRPNSFG